MIVPLPGQSVHLMTWRDVLCQRHRIDGRNRAELQLHTTDDLRRLYIETGDDLVRLRDGILTRAELVAEIRWRIFWARFGYGSLLVLSAIAAIAAVFAAVEGWPWPRT